MRWGWVLSLLLAAVCAVAWTKDDYEIFDLVSELEAAEGKGTTFYSHLGVEPGASLSEITKAYRKRSLELHPDKNPGVKNIHDRFARLGVISQILRNAERRERYNFFHKNGVPKWRGTGYYYSRFRPTLAHVLLFLAAVSTGVQYLVMRLGYARDTARVKYFQDAALSAAGARRVMAQVGGGGDGPDGVGAEGKKGRAAATGARRKVKVAMVEGSDQRGHLELIVKDGEVFLPGDHGDLHPLGELARPASIWKTWPCRLSLLLARKAAALFPASAQSRLPKSLRANGTLHDEGEEGEDEDEDEDAPLDTPTPAPRPRDVLRAKKQSLSRSRSGTPSSVPTTELSSDEGEDGSAVNDGKKKKRGLGKSGAMRKRKMGMKR